jgi:hypothetical protein
MSKFERFDVDLEGKTNSSRWKVWLRRFDLYVEANGITTLFNEAGSVIEEINKAIRKTDVAKKDEKYEDISKLITDHFEPQKNTNLS